MSLKDPIGAEAAASIDGAPASLDDAAAAAARLLARSSQPLIAGLGADIEGARAAIALAERVGGVIEHMHSAAMLARSRLSARNRRHAHDARRSARARRRRAARRRRPCTETWPVLTERLLASAGKAGRRGRQAAHRLAGAAALTQEFLASTAISRSSRRDLAQRSPPILPRCARASKAVPSREPRDSFVRARRARGRSERRAVRRGGLDGGKSRSARNRDAQRPRARLERNDAVLDIAACRAGQWRGRARGLRMDDRLSRCEPDSAPARPSMILGVSTPSDSSRQGKPIACCGFPPLERPRRHGRAR